MDMTRRGLFGLVAAVAVAPAAAAWSPPASHVAAVLARHPWIERGGRLETLALAVKLAERMGWPIVGTRALVRAAGRATGPQYDRAAFVADLDWRIAALLASGQTPPPGPAALEAKLAKGAAGIERYRTRAA